ncbi:MAG: flagellar motor switch protein FliG [Spirochaeta sp.]
MKMESRRISAYSRGTDQASAKKTGNQHFGSKTARDSAAAPDDPQAGPSRTLTGLLKLVSEPGEGKFKQVATFLMLIGQEEAAKILRYLPEDIVGRLSEEIAQSRYIPKGEARSVLERFERLQEHDDGRIIGGADTAQAILVRAFGEEQGKSLLYRAVPDAKPNRFSFLRELDPRQLRILLKDESVAVIAIVLSAVPAKMASQVLGQYDADARLQITRRIAKAGKVDGAVLDRVGEKLKERIRRQGHAVTEEVDGSSRLAAILKHIDLRSEERILDSLRQNSPEVSERVREQLFTIDTIMDIDDRDLQSVLQEFADIEIALLLKGKEQAIREKIMRNISTGRQELIASEYTHLGAQLRSEVDAATKDFIAHLRKLEDEGRIRIRRKEDEWTTS